MDPTIQKDLEAAQALGLTYREYIIRKAAAVKRRCMGPMYARTRHCPEVDQATKKVELIPFTLPEPVDALEVKQQQIEEAEAKCLVYQCKAGELDATIRQLKADYQKSHLPHYREWLENQKLEDQLKPTIHLIAYQTCQRWGITLEDLRGHSRDTRISLPRMEFSFRCRTEAGKSWGEIGRFIHKDHTTILNGWRRYRQFIRMKAAGKPAPRTYLEKFWPMLLEERE